MLCDKGSCLTFCRNNFIKITYVEMIYATTEQTLIFPCANTQAFIHASGLLILMVTPPPSTLYLIETVFELRKLPENWEIRLGNYDDYRRRIIVKIRT